MINEKELWEKCAAFHGHVCGGLTIGYKAALYAIKLLDLTFSEDEEMVCICENDACGVDAIQVILGCTAGKGNLLFHMTGKQAFSFYNRKNGKSVRLVLKKRPNNMSKEESFAYFQECKSEDMFDIKPVRIELPEPARLFNSMECEECGETAAETYIAVQNGKHVCIDCRKQYSRFAV